MSQHGKVREEQAATTPAPVSRAETGWLVGLFAWLLTHRPLLVGGLLLALAWGGWHASGVRFDQSVEQMFPVQDPTRATYDRYKGLFPYDDARAIVLVEDSRVWSPAGLQALQELEADLLALPGATDVEGPLSVRDVTGGADTISLARLVPDVRLPTPARQQAERTARADPLFAYNLAHPDRDVVAIRVRLRLDLARSDEGRRVFNAAADEVIAAHAPRWRKLLLTGIPVIRGRYIELVQRDLNLLSPLAYLIITLLIALTFRSLHVVLATVLTIAAAIVWTFAAMKLLDIPIAILTSFCPIVIIVISISDTVHIVADFLERLRRGEERRPALAAALADAAGPCLLTEITIACGFLSMGLVNITAIWEFGLVMAIGMGVTWLANMTVLPLVLSLGRPRLCGTSPAGAGSRATPLAPPLAIRLWGRAVDGIEHLVRHRTRRVVGVAVSLLLLAALAGSTVDRVHFVFDDLWPASSLYQDIRFGETRYGGLVPLAVFLEAERPATEGMSVLEPEALRFLDRAEEHLRELGRSGELPVATAVSVATYLRKSHRLVVGDAQAAQDGGLPTSRAAAAQEFLLLDDGDEFKDLISPDGAAAALITRLPDLPAETVSAGLRQLERWVAANAPPGYRASVTGILALSNRVYELLLQGLVQSFLVAFGVTFLVFFFVLRSSRLALVGVVPNVAPVVMMLGYMALFGIDLKPSTVLLFSMVLVVADDDTIQYLSRFRRRYGRLRRLGDPDPHGRAALGLLRELGLPMFITSTAVALGFLLLSFSEFRATANLGMIAGLTLFSAVLADLFLVPVILRAWKPRVGRDG